MSKNQTQTISLAEKIRNVFFGKKVVFSISNNCNLEDQIVLFSNDVLGLRVQSVALPDNFTNEPKTQAQVLWWLRNRIHNKHISAYVLALKYRKKLNLQLPANPKYTLSNLDNDKYKNFSVAKSK